MVGNMDKNIKTTLEEKDVILTVSIVLYRNYKDAYEAVASIEKNTDEKISKIIYLIDNSALDKADEQWQEKELFKNNLEGFSDVIYIDTNKNMGFGKGHNVVLDRIHSKYHAIVNPDIILTDDAFAAIIQYMNSDPTIGMVIPKLVDADGNIQKAYRRELTKKDMYIRMFAKRGFNKRKAYHTMQDMDYSKPFQVPFGQGSFLVIRTDLFKMLSGFDDRYFMYLEDADLCKRVNELSKLMYFPDATVIHKWERASHKNVKLLWIHLQSMHQYFKKWR